MKKYINNWMKFTLLLGMIFLFNYSAQSQDDKSPFTNGDIISSKTLNIRSMPTLSQKAYDTNVFAVFYESPTAINDATRRESPFKKGGVLYVKVNNSNGSIKAGDAITSSDVPGEGMKATESGIIVGIALEDASSETDLVKTRVMFQYVR